MENDNAPMVSTDLQVVRVLDEKLKSRHPEGVSLMQTLEGGKVLELHRLICLAFNPSACSKAEELTGYLWKVGRVLSLEPVGGITVRGGMPDETFNIGRTFFREAEAEYRMIHRMVAEVI